MLNLDWKDKPPLGTPLRGDGHWSVRDTSTLDCVFFYNELGRPSIGNLSGLGNTKGVISGATWGNGGLNFTNNTTNRVTLPGTLPSTTKLTVIWRGKINTAVAANLRLISGAGTGGASFLLGTSSASSYMRPRFVMSNTVPTAFTAQGTVAMNVNQTYTLIGVFDGSFLYLYVDGVLAATSSAWSGTPLATNSFYDGYDGTTNSCGHFTEMLQIHPSVAFSAQEVRAITENPWQVAQPQTMWLPGMVVGGTTVTAIVGHASYSGKVATVLQPQLVTAIVGHASYSGKVATVSQPHLVTAIVGHASYSGKVATVLQPHLVTAIVGHASYSGKVATIKQAVVIVAISGHASYSGKIATISRTANISISAITGHANYRGRVSTISNGQAIKFHIDDPPYNLPIIDENNMMPFPWRIWFQNLTKIINNM